MIISEMCGKSFVILCEKYKLCIYCLYEPYCNLKKNCYNWWSMYQRVRAEFVSLCKLSYVSQLKCLVK